MNVSTPSAYSLARSVRQRRFDDRAGWRALSQLVLQPAPTDWARRHLRRSLEHALAPEGAEATRSGEGPGWGGVVLALVGLVAVVALPRLWALYLAHGSLATAVVLVPVVVGVGGLYALWLHLRSVPCTTSTW